MASRHLCNYCCSFTRDVFPNKKEKSVILNDGPQPNPVEIGRAEELPSDNEVLDHIKSWFSKRPHELRALEEQIGELDNLTLSHEQASVIRKMVYGIGKAKSEEEFEKIRSEFPLTNTPNDITIINAIFNLFQSISSIAMYIGVKDTESLARQAIDKFNEM